MPFKRGFGYIFTDQPGINVSTTIAHELAHGAFNLRHTFTEFPAVSESSTDNLMDYKGGTALKKYQWDYVHDPERMVGWLQGDEESASICTWWYQNVSSYLFPNDTDKQLESHSSLFENVRNNFDTYLASSTTDNLALPSFPSWSVRKSSFNATNNLTLIEKVIKKLLDQPESVFKLTQNGIYLGKYRIEENDYRIAVYSEMQNLSTQKVVVDNICKLVDNDHIKIIIEDNYIIVAFFKDKLLQMSIQILSSEDDDAKLWLKYLGIFVEGPTIMEQVRAFWNGLWKEEKEDDSFYGDIVDFPQIAPTSIYAYENNNFKGGIYGCHRKVTSTNSQTATCGNVMTPDSLYYLKHHNGLDIYAPPGTDLKAVVNGTVTYQASSGMAGNKVKLSGTTHDGKTVLYVYCHVENMASGLQDGETVQKGDVIAVAGATGNASDVPFKHCHLTIYINGEECSTPSDYIKTKFDEDGKPDHNQITALQATN